jgi:hypothetical protein
LLDWTISSHFFFFFYNSFFFLFVCTRYTNVSVIKDIIIIIWCKPLIPILYNVQVILDQNLNFGGRLWPWPSTFDLNIPFRHAIPRTLTICQKLDFHPHWHLRYREHKFGYRRTHRQTHKKSVIDWDKEIFGKILLWKYSWDLTKLIATFHQGNNSWYPVL